MCYRVRRDYTGYWFPIPMSDQDAEAYVKLQKEMAEEHRAVMPSDAYEICANYTVKKAKGEENADRRRIAELRNLLTDNVLAMGDNPDDYLVAEYFSEVTKLVNAQPRHQEWTSDHAQSLILQARTELLQQLGGAHSLCVPSEYGPEIHCFVLVRADEHAFHAKLTGVKLYWINEVNCWNKLVN